MPSTRISRRATALAAFAAFFVASASGAGNRTCYYPDGSVSPSDYACAETGTTHCCNDMSACLSTGYCMSAEQPPYVISRGSCTDNAWGTGCPAKCAGTNDDPSGGMPISWMGTTNNAGSPLYCCGPLTVVNGSLACANGEDSFVLGTSEILYGVAILANTTTTNGTASSSTAKTGASETASSPASSSSSASSSSGDAPDTLSTAAAAATTSKSNVTAVGAGVGVSLGVAAAAFAAWALYERRKRTQQLQAFMNGTFVPDMAMANTQPPGGAPGGGSPGAGGYADMAAGGDAALGHSGSTGTPFSPNGTTTGTMTTSSPVNGGNTVYAASMTGTSKMYQESQSPLVELSAYPRQFEELPAHNN
ncbi:hypothetical protein SCUCBS95973_003382 [Sporothrix curviconia]|uniref:Uncharacterized protein n=1 Tax=Sporothrix curviconia TaxID=1260050 RepID=A0ABP0BEW5_9PEZI